MLEFSTSRPCASASRTIPTGQLVPPNSPYGLLLALRGRGIEVRAADSELRVSARPGLLDDATCRDIAARKAELIAFLGAGLARDVSKEARFSADDVAESEGVRAPLAPAQRRLWLLSQLEPCASAYSLPYAFRSTVPLDVSALRAALAHLAARHEALRTRIEQDGARAFARCDVQVPEAMVVDLTDEPEQLLAALARAAAEPFDLRAGPLFRATIYVLPEHHVLFFHVHHIVCDGWSIELLIEELLTAYAAYATHQTPPLPPCSARFSEYARWECARADDARFASERERATARLRGIEPLEMPTDHRRPVVFTYRGETVHFTLPAELVRAVAELARRNDTTPYVVLLAGYKLLLARYSGQHDILVGSPAAGRDRSDSEHVVGFFARTLLIRSAIDLHWSFDRLVAQVKGACLAALSDQHVPFEQLVKALAPDRERSRTPLFQTLFSLQETTPRIDPVSGLSLESLPLDSGGAKTDLTLLLEHDGTCVHGKLEFASDLFERRTAERLVANYQTLLESVAVAPGEPAGHAQLLHAEERRELAAVNRTVRALPEVGGFHALFQAQARRTPNNVALVDQAGSVSYAELDRRSDEWAAQLAARGVERGTRVGIALTRTRRVLEVALGALKAGAAYVPFDTGFPRERLAFMAEDACVSLVVTERESEAALPAGAFTVLRAEDIERAPPAAALARPCSGPDDIAYIIYTSGSTGTPKGVEVRHGGVINLLTSMASVPGCDQRDRVLAVSIFSFDMCIAELYLPLVVGARTILAPRTCAADGAALARFIDEYGATIVQATPTTFKLLVEAGLPRQRFKAIAGGEAFPGELARALGQHCSEVWNGYGPTETTVYATFYRVAQPEQPVLIGKPIANTRLHVLDAAGAEVPFGVAGELYIAGAGVSAGYRNQPALTRQRFVPDSFSKNGDARMYRTGDVVRMRADGVQYVGRADHQVKLRGYRIELDEISNVLARHERIEQCTVVVRELGDDDKRLVAYVVAKPGAHGLELERALRAHLERHLPRYMVPRLIVQLDALPLTPSGKIDAKQLPDPRGRLLGADAPERALPSDATERALHEVWQRVLGITDIASDDDFFALGGHSLLAVQLVQEINRALHSALSLSVIFDSPTIRALAERIDLGEHSGGMSVVPLARGGTELPLFCICGINLYQKLADELAPERPVYGMFLPVEGELFRDRELELDAREMARQYVAGIRAVQPHGPYYLTGISFGGVLAYEIAQQLVARGEQVALLALLEVILPEPPGSSRVGKLGRRIMSLANRLPDVLTRLRAFVARPSLQVEPARSAQPTVGADRLDHRMQRYQRALARYVGDMPPYRGKVVLFRGRDQVRAMPGCRSDYGWRRYARGSFQRFDIPGDHLGILDTPAVGELARLLRPCLQRP